MQLVFGWLGGLCLFAGVCVFVLSFRLMLRWDVYPAAWFPEGWGMVRWGAYFGTSLTLMTGFGLLGVWISHLGTKKEG